MRKGPTQAQKLGIPVYAATDPCVSAPAAHRGRGAGGDPPAEGAVRARHAEQRPRPQHRRRQGDPRARAVLQGEGPGDGGRRRGRLRGPKSSRPYRE